MKLFALSLEEDAFDWFSDLDAGSFKTFKEFEKGFLAKWGDKKEDRYLLASLNNMKKNENETMEEFNKRFNNLISSLHAEIKPPDGSILIHYIESFNGEMRYQLRDKEPVDLKKAQVIAEKIDKNMQSSGKSNLPGFTRGTTSKQSDNKDKSASTDSKDLAKDPLRELTDVIKAMEANHAAQMNSMQNRLIAMEREKSHMPSNRFPPRQNNEWKQKYPSNNQRIPSQLDSANMVMEEVPPFCRACNEFHDESTCPKFNYINEQGPPEVNNFVGYSNQPEYINHVGKTHTLPKDVWKQAKEMAQEKDNVTKIYGEKPTPEEIKELAKFKGFTYQGRKTVIPIKSDLHIPKVTHLPSP
jgi:hypothetical protein